MTKTIPERIAPEVEDTAEDVAWELVRILKALVNMVEDSLKGLRHTDTRQPFVAGFSDMEITPDGSLRLSDARTAIAKAERVLGRDER